MTDRAYLRPYMDGRDRFVGSPPPASTLMIVAGFARPEFKVEVEVVAAGRAADFALLRPAPSWQGAGPSPGKDDAAA